MPKTSTILHQSICLHTHKTHRFTNLQIPYMTTNLQISTKSQKYQEEKYHKSQKYKEKIRMVYLCVQAWLWYDEAVRKVYNDKMSDYLYQNHKNKKYMLSKCPFKRKTEEKEKKMVYTRMNCSMHNCSQFILVGGICWTLKIRKLI